MFFNTKTYNSFMLRNLYGFYFIVYCDIVISGTRVYIESDQKSVNVRLEIKGITRCLSRVG